MATAAATGLPQVITAQTITSPQTLPPAVFGQPYSYQLTAMSAETPYVWCSNALPNGFSLSSSGLLSNPNVSPPTPFGTNYFTLNIYIANTCTDSSPYDQKSLILPVTSPPVITINPATLPPAEVNQTYSYTFSASGGSGITWSLQGAPSWLTISSSGTISGTPPNTSPVSFTVVASSGGSSAGLPVGLTVYPALVIGPVTLPPGVVNVPYSQKFPLSGGTGQGYSVSAAGAPPGLGVSTSGVLSGTPSSAGTFTITLKLTDSAGYSVTNSFPLLIDPALAITTTSLPAATAGTAYSQTLAASGGTGGYAWSGSGLPSWLRLSSDGVLSGTPPAAGSFPFNVTVKDSAGNSAGASLTLLVNTTLRITTTSLPDGVFGADYSALLGTTGAVGSVTFTLISGALPTKLALSSAGGISGPVTAAGDFTFTVQAVDTSGAKATASLTIHIPQPPTSNITATLGSTLTPASQPAVNISISPAYALPISFNATVAISPDLGGATDLGFSNGSRSIQFTVPANTAEYQLPFSTGTSAGTITVTLVVTTTGQSLTVSGPIVLTGQLSAQPPTLGSVTATASGSTVTVVVTGYSVTRDMTKAQFHFTAAAGATLTTTDFPVDVSSQFSNWYSNSASFATGSQFKLTMPFNISGSISAIASVTVTMTNSNGTSAPVTANLH